MKKRRRSKKKVDATSKTIIRIYLFIIYLFFYISNFPAKGYVYAKNACTLKSKFPVFSLLLLPFSCLKCVKHLFCSVQATQTCAEALHHETKMRDCSGRCATRHRQTYYSYLFIRSLFCFLNLSFRSTSFCFNVARRMYTGDKEKKI